MNQVTELTLEQDFSLRRFVDQVEQMSQGSSRHTGKKVQHRLESSVPIES